MPNLPFQNLVPLTFLIENVEYKTKKTHNDKRGQNRDRNEHGDLVRVEHLLRLDLAEGAGPVVVLVENVAGAARLQIFGHLAHAVVLTELEVVVH